MRDFSLKSTITYKLYRQIILQLEDFLSTIGDIVIYGKEVLSLIFKRELDWSKIWS